MKREFLTFSLLLIINIGFTQSFCDRSSYGFVKIPDCPRPVGLQVDLFNHMAKHFGIKDTISYTCQDNEIVYEYKNEIITDWKYDPKLCGEKLMLRGGKSSMGFIMLASIPTQNGQSQVYEFIHFEKERGRFVFKEYKEQGILPFGKYVEKNCDGHVVAEGEYELIDIPSTYAYNWYDDEKRASVASSIRNDKTSVKKGLWKYYDEKGTLLYEENYLDGEQKVSALLNDLCIDFEKKKIWNYYKTEKISPAIEIFNEINSILKRPMKLSYDITHRGLVYYLNGSIIANPFFDMDGKYKRWDYQMKNHEGDLLLEYLGANRLNVYIPSEKGEGEAMYFSTFNRAKNLEVFKTQNYYPNGAFERINCKGTVIVKGDYSTIDTLYSTWKEGFDPDTYAKKMIETVIDHKTIKAGQWSYFNDNGELILEEHYPGVANWTLFSDYLCVTLKDESREMVKNIPNSFIVFNTVCDLFDLDCWISEDDVLGETEYYCNGQLIDVPETAPQRNNAVDVNIKTSNATVQMRTISNDYAALGKLEKEKKVRLTASIKYDNGKEENLSLLDNTLTRYQTLNKQNRSGLYEKRQCDGLLLIKGQYCLVDSLHKDTLTTISTETYEETIQIIESDVFEKKYGVWYYYDSKGIVLREEDYGKCEQ